MDISLRTLKKREQMEKDIDILQEVERVAREKFHTFGSECEKKKTQYYKWLRENKLDGLKYKLPQ